MNYLQLGQRLRRRCNASGAGPSSTQGQNEDYSKLLDFVNEAWVSIQQLHPNWLWMRASMTFPTVANQPAYTLAQIQATGAGLANFSYWERDSFRCYLTAIGYPNELPLAYRPYDQWRDLYQIGSLRSAPSQPIVLTTLPALGIGLGPTPLAGYTISGDYFAAPTELTEDADIPAMPAQFHMLIVYRAMMLYASGEAAGEVYQAGSNLYNEMIGRLELSQLPEFLSAGGMI